jgi:hypothetical protein
MELFTIPISLVRVSHGVWVLTTGPAVPLFLASGTARGLPSGPTAPRIPAPARYCIIEGPILPSGYAIIPYTQGS